MSTDHEYVVVVRREPVQPQGPVAELHQGGSVRGRRDRRYVSQVDDFPRLTVSPSSSVKLEERCHRHDLPPLLAIT